ncbi:hypothetical protein BD324DRAFT_648994 [Kockovaella imperatae]|uniref:Homeobox domain-containing protein n=1 Tax=Kockovaella imperatae TaxID=4999 RepID=A0A1Y1ULM9_9TREE|nr:hypothetical protein BD324DRAFT_648994 [Kockovaella imperatae]ORX38889.1 hypothetical protein BD324DRAFT_648994 [Kockovaella imperatae]
MQQFSQSSSTFAPPPQAPKQHLEPAFQQLTSPIHPTPFPNHGDRLAMPRNGAYMHMAPQGPGPMQPPQTFVGWPQPGEWEDETAPAEVKHRRRTTPDQLRVLEHWFKVNPKPDNNMREWLALELGMTKRNIQVWFQNRRAKVKSIALKERAAQEGGLRTPPKTAPAQLSNGPRPPLTGQLAPPTQVGRRVSFADADQSVAGHFAARSPGLRKGSIPYAIPEDSISPIQSRPSALHLAAMNNSRRASVPNAQTVPSGPFTPPRFTPIRGAAGEVVPVDKPLVVQDASATVAPAVAQPQYTGAPYPSGIPPFTPNGPLPSPGFQFGTHAGPAGEIPPGSWSWMPRDRIGSMASLNTYTTDGTTASEWDSDWMAAIPTGFEPDNRRASAPAELLQQLGILGLNPNVPQVNVSTVPVDPMSASSSGMGSSSSPNFYTPPFNLHPRRHSTSPASPGSESPTKYFDPPAPTAPVYQAATSLNPAFLRPNDRSISAPVIATMSPGPAIPGFNDYSIEGFGSTLSVVSEKPGTEDREDGTGYFGLSGTSVDPVNVMG